MPLFIVRPKTGAPSRFASLGQRKVTLSARKKQVKEVIFLNNDDPTQQEIRKWISDHPGVKEITTARDEQVLGLHLVQMTSDAARQFNNDLALAEAIPDRPLELIRPEKSGKQSDSPRHFGENWTKFIRTELSMASHTGKGVTVAVLDTGVEADHPEFGGTQIAGGYTFDLATGAAVAQTPCVDTDTHGTHVAGLICGKTVGFAPNASVLSGVMIPGNRGSVASFLIAMSWAAARPEVQIVHLSAGLPGYVPEMRDAVETLHACGVLTVAAIGNEGRNLTRSPGNFAEVLSVGSVGIAPRGYRGDYRVSPFSSTGQMVVESHMYSVPRVFAPGENIRSCVPGGGYASLSGTSMAAPQVSGLAACLIERNPGITLSDLLAEIDEILTVANFALGVFCGNGNFFYPDPRMVIDIVNYVRRHS